MKRLKDIPKFKTEDEEREFWTTHDSGEYVDWDEAEAVAFPKLKPGRFDPDLHPGMDALLSGSEPSFKTISLRLPESMLDDLRVIANKMDVPYQSLIKIFLRERIARELKQSQ